MAYRAIAFDVDGTLLDTYYTASTSLKRALDKIGISYTEEQLVASFAMTDADLPAFFGIPDHQVDAFRQYNQQFYLEEMKHVHLFPQVVEVLEILRKKKVILGLVTSRNHREIATEAVLQEILPYFDVVVSSDDIENPKPDSEPMVLFQTLAHCQSTDILFIGDTMTDANCAKNARVDFAGAEWGACEPLPGKYHFESIAEVLSYI